MKTKIKISRSGGTFAECLFIIFCTLATVVFSIGLFTFKSRAKDENYPFEIMIAIENLENRKGMIHMQRKDLETVSKALKIGVITSEDLGRSGEDWVKEQSQRVNAREVKIYWNQLQRLGEDARYGLSKWQKSEAERLSKLIEDQLDIPFAKEEGLIVSKSDLEFCLYRVYHYGGKPCKSDQSALLGSSNSP